jgi:hypothetical protein
MVSPAPIETDATPSIGLILMIQRFIMAWKNVLQAARENM